MYPHLKDAPLDLLEITEVTQFQRHYPPDYEGSRFPVAEPIKPRVEDVGLDHREHARIVDYILLANQAKIVIGCSGRCPRRWRAELELQAQCRFPLSLSCAAALS
jgi:hypothetical protein